MWTQPARQFVEEQARHTSLFQQLAVALASTIDTTEVARVVTVTVTETLRADASSIIRIDHSGTCQLLAAGGVPAERLAGWSSFDLASYPAVVELMRARRPILVTADEWSRRFPASALLDRLCSIWAVLPLVTNDEPVGMAAFGWFEEKQFASQELDPGPGLVVRPQAVAVFKPLMEPRRVPIGLAVLPGVDYLRDLNDLGRAQVLLDEVLRDLDGAARQDDARVRGRELVVFEDLGPLGGILEISLRNLPQSVARLDRYVLQFGLRSARGARVRRSGATRTIVDGPFPTPLFPAQ